MSLLRDRNLARAAELEAEAARLRREAEADEIECVVTMTSIGTAQADLWEASCPCNFWTRGTKAQCEERANGHPPHKIE